MAPINPHATPRLWVDYTSFGLQHTMQFRFEDGQTAQGAIGVVTQLLVAMSQIMRSADSFYAVRFAAGQSDISFPATFTPIQGQASNATANGDYQALFLSFVGRDTIAGRRVRFEFFSAASAVPQPDNNRIQLGDNEYIDSILAAFTNSTIEAEPGAAIVTIAKEPPVMNAYANVAFNSYWQRKQRRTGT